MLKTILITVSMVMALGMYPPLWLRLHRRKHTRDFSKVFQILNFLVQVNNGFLAYIEHAPFLRAWYVVQAVMTGVTLYLVIHYWNRLPPEIPQEIIEQRMSKSLARVG